MSGNEEGSEKLKVTMKIRDKKKSGMTRRRSHLNK